MQDGIPEKGDDLGFQAVLTRADELLGQDDSIGALTELTVALETFGDQPEILEKLAELEKQQGFSEAAVSHLLQAAAISPEDPGILSKYAALLTEVGLERKAIEFINSLSDKLREHVLLREALANIYVGNHWHALAVQAFGNAKDLSSRARHRQRRSWWLSGGPIKPVRSLILGLDKGARSTWRYFSENLVVFDSLNQPQGFAAETVRANIDSYERAWSQLAVRLKVIVDITKAIAFLGTVIITWFALSMTIHVANHHTDSSLTSNTVLYTVGYALIPIALLVKVTGWFTSYRLVAALVGSAVYVGLGAFLLNVAPPPSWQGEAGLGLFVAVFYFWLDNISEGLIDFATEARFKRLWKEHPSEAMLALLLNVILDMTKPNYKNSLEQRRSWMVMLEYAAKLLEHEMPIMFRSGNAETDSWISERAKGAAAALRKISLQIALQSATSWDRLASILRSEVSALASGDLAALRWAPPPTPETRRNRIQRVAITASRTLVVMLVPIAALLLLKPILNLNPHQFTIARISCISWAVLYLLITIDPSLNDKITTARNLLSLARPDKEQRPGLPDKSTRGQLPTVGRRHRWPPDL